MISRHLFDTYAVIEILKGGTNYKLFVDSEIIINDFIFAELCYNLYREKEPRSREYLDEYAQYIVPVNSDWIEEAMEFRLKWKDRKVSITDCIGYIMAKKLGIKFLTGDKEFENLENIEFVK